MQTISPFETILSKLRHLCPPQKVLEIGCGDGALIFEIGRRYKVSAVGIDLDRSLIDIAQKKAIEFSVDDQINFFPWNAEHANFEHELFDLVILNDTLSVLDHPEEVVDQIATLLKSTGMLLVAESSERLPPASIDTLIEPRFSVLSDESIERTRFLCAIKIPV